MKTFVAKRDHKQAACFDFENHFQVGNSNSEFANTLRSSTDADQVNCDFERIDYF